MKKTRPAYVARHAVTRECVASQRATRGSVPNLRAGDYPQTDTLCNVRFGHRTTLLGRRVWTCPGQHSAVLYCARTAHAARSLYNSYKVVCRERFFQQRPKHGW